MADFRLLNYVDSPATLQMEQHLCFNLAFEFEEVVCMILSVAATEIRWWSLQIKEICGLWRAFKSLVIIVYRLFLQFNCALLNTNPKLNSVEHRIP